MLGRLFVAVALGALTPWMGCDAQPAPPQPRGSDSAFAGDLSDAGSTGAEKEGAVPKRPDATHVGNTVPPATIADALPVDGKTSSEQPVTLLLGLRTKRVGTYHAQLGDEPLSSSLDEPGYRMLLIHFDGTSVRLAGQLPYLAVPQRRGFRFIGEANVHEGSEEAESADPTSPPKYYSASQLWMTHDKRSVKRAERNAQAALQHERACGETAQQTVIYVTPKALCRFDSQSSWVGGAHFISGTEEERLLWLDGSRRGTRLVQHVARPVFEDAVKRMFADWNQGRDEPIVWAGVQNFGWGEIEWDRDTYVCLGRQDGRVIMTATATFPTMSCRNAVWSTELRPAHEDVGVRHAPSVSPSAFRSAIPDLVDAYVSPENRVVVLHLPNRLVVYRPHGDLHELVGEPGRHWDEETVALEIPVAGRPVMEEWAIGSHAVRWARELAPSQ